MPDEVIPLSWVASGFSLIAAKRQRPRRGRWSRCGETGEARSLHSGAVPRSGSITGKSPAATEGEVRLWVAVIMI